MPPSVFFKAHQEELPFDTKELKKEREQLSGELSEKNEGLQAVQEDMKLLRDVRYWINHVLPPDQRRVVPEPGKKPSINEQLSWKIEGAKQREEQKTPAAPPPAKTGYGTLTNQALAIFPVRMTGAFLVSGGFAY